MCLEIIKNLKNTSLSMLSGFLDSNLCIQIRPADNAKHVNTPHTYYDCRSQGYLRVSLVKFCLYLVSYTCIYIKQNVESLVNRSIL